MSKKTSEPGRRRRGQGLEAELLASAWQELVEVGYANLTMESVAARARTGGAVLYRRWPNKEELLIAAMVHHQSSHPVEVPDTGTLRGDLLAALSIMGEIRTHFYIVLISTAFSGLLTKTGLTFAQLRERLLSKPQLSRAQNIYERAELRGEIDLGHTPPAVLAMPFELVRYDLIMNPGPIRRARIRTILDDLFLPLIQLNNQQKEQRSRKSRKRTS
jgi:AcrR family transcriptional regulator